MTHRFSSLRNMYSISTTWQLYIVLSMMMTNYLVVTFSSDQIVITMTYTIDGEHNTDNKGRWLTQVAESVWIIEVYIYWMKLYRYFGLYTKVSVPGACMNSIGCWLKVTISFIWIVCYFTCHYIHPYITFTVWYPSLLEQASNQWPH